ncbi:MAG: viral A-type inclusion protein [Bacteroidota bacterium]|nr:viral A-type inclusion protein [Bacteroidota bacterium]
MKKFILPVVGLLACIAVACNNSNKKNDEHSGQTHSGDKPKTQADSLMAAIDDGHIVGMSKIGKLHNTQKKVQGIIDSIGKLPAKAKQAAAPYVAKLQVLVKDLKYADFAMDKWMTEYDMDSAINNMEQRIKYLTDEKMKVGKMKEAILGGLQKADSLLREKF